MKRRGPWEDGEKFILEHCVFDSGHAGTSAALFQRASGAVGYKCQHNSCAGRHWRDVRRTFEADYDPNRTWNKGGPSAEAASAPEAEKHGGGFRFTQVGELLSEPAETHDYVWDQSLPTAGLSLIAAKPKVGKSTLVRNLARAVSRGESFLGRSTKRGAVVYLELEEKRAQVAKHFRSMGVQGDEEIFIHTGPAPGSDVLGELRVAIEQHGAVLAVVDPLFKLARLKDGNDYAEVTRALEPLMTIARETGCHILLIHHFGKGDREDGDQVLGSTALFASVDTALFMRKREDFRTLNSTQRYGTDIEGLALTFDKATGMVGTSGSVADAEDAKAMAAISEFFETQTDGVTREEILSAIEGRALVVKRALNRGSKRKNSPNGVPEKRATLTSTKNSCLLGPIYIRDQGTKKRKMGQNPRQTPRNFLVPRIEKIPTDGTKNSGVGTKNPGSKILLRMVMTQQRILKTWRTLNERRHHRPAHRRSSTLRRRAPHHRRQAQGRSVRPLTGAPEGRAPLCRRRGQGASAHSPPTDEMGMVPTFAPGRC